MQFRSRAAFVLARLNDFAVIGRSSTYLPLGGPLSRALVSRSNLPTTHLSSSPVPQPPSPALHLQAAWALRGAFDQDWHFALQRTQGPIAALLSAPRLCAACAAVAEPQKGLPCARQRLRPHHTSAAMGMCHGSGRRLARAPVLTPFTVCRHVRIETVAGAGGGAAAHARD